MRSDDDLHDSPDRNLLFGIIALQNNFITREALVAGFDAWVQDKSTTLAQWLQRQRALSADDREILERLVAKFLDKHGGDAEKSLAALSPVPEVRVDLERLNDPDLGASLGHVGQAAPLDPRLESTIPFITGTSLGRFRVLRPHAKGGLGQVSIALDQELNREVALKEIQPQHADDAVARERFVVEAEITGGLEHPGIVPVYALGQGPDGRPFYAMRFVKGDSLKQAIEVFHKPDNPNRKDAGARQLALRQLLGRFIDVCNAMEYAHSRGVLHRDLKPGNIMVGKYGETLLVDWGLAKSVGRKEIVSDEPTLRPSSALSSSGQTQPGSAIGTPAYMSPEQAAGRLEELSPASDVYSLGATLYHVLCGKPPFEKAEHTEIVAKVQRGDFPRPRSIIREVPAALEAICLKAMALKPADRYPTARALADDLEHWLADERVVAAPDSLGARCSRFARKHRGYVRAGAVALVLLAVVATGAAFLINEQRNRNVQSLYLARMNLAQNAWESTQCGALLDLLDRCSPGTGQRDLRGFEWYYWNRLAHRDLLTISHGPPGDAGVAFSPDGTRVVSWNSRTGLRTWDTAAGQEVHIFNSHTQHVTSVAFNPEGTLVASAGPDRPIKLWDAKTGRETLTLAAQTVGVPHVAFSPDGKRIASLKQNTITFWDGSSGQELHSIKAGSHFAFSPDGARIASASENDSTVRIWDVMSGEASLTLKWHMGGIQCVAYSPDGTRIASGGRDMTLKLWDAATGRELLLLKGHTADVTDVTFSPNGAHLASASRDTTLKLWDVTSGREALTIKGHTDGITGVAFCPDGAQIASASLDSTVKIWDAGLAPETTSFVAHLGEVYCVAFSPDGKKVASAGTDGAIKLWDVATTRELLTIQSDRGPALNVAFSPDGTRLGSVAIARTNTGDTLVRLWDVVTGKEILTLNENQGRFKGIAFNPDGKHVAAVDSVMSTVSFWDTGTGQKAFTFHLQLREGAAAFIYTYSTTGVAFSSDGRRFATPIADQTVRVWDTALRQEIHTLSGHRARVHSVAFSPDGKQIASSAGRLTAAEHSAFSENTVKLWDAATGKEAQTLTGHTDGVLSIAFSPDGTRIASASLDRTVKLWDTISGQETLTLKGHTGGVLSIAFSPDGTRIASGSGDGTMRIWEAPKSKPRMPAPRGAALTLHHAAALKYFMNKKYRECISECRAALAIVPDRPELRELVVKAALWLQDSGTVDEQLAILAKTKPRAPWLFHEYGSVQAANQRWMEAADAYRRASRFAPEEIWFVYWLAVAQRAAGDANAYRQTCREMLDRFGKQPSAEVAARILFTGLPGNGLEANDYLRLAEISREKRLLAAALCRDGQYDASLATFAPESSEFLGRAWDWLFVAIASHGAGKLDGARESLEKARQWIANADAQPDANLKPDAWGGWWDRASVAILLTEVENLLGGEEKSDD